MNYKNVLLKKERNRIKKQKEKEFMEAINNLSELLDNRFRR